MKRSPSCLGEAYGTDMMPAWRYLLWKLDPRRLIRHKPELKWSTDFRHEHVANKQVGLNARFQRISSWLVNDNESQETACD